MDPGHAVSTLFGGDDRNILQNVHLLLTRSELEFDSALPPTVRHGNLHRGAGTHPGKLIVDRRRCRFSVELYDAISNGHSNAVCIAVDVDGSHLGLAAKVCAGCEPGGRSL